ncbi:peptidoglycan editing factor PgeF [Legionella bononiensis]|uniref:Purine nucleoside phosphorylase n=1 Tax=Legionella bononiensis TaxID=2793102 RepID=A0ABS1WBJ4_9GAMM|nr:peptidoglycan editing factor PgeF [Legionella bononiensis]MBL7481029.1 peptidoglycan editing factor PgeF [Legionella bononiensis]MBL7526737.1 peptidoglycan editing factor PgeF [Legionella bononiensis]MBL7564144.1 peptidoglycan editing factor PgeF [Legionella bononiensis]
MTTKLANWSAPLNISALSTTRLSGYSLPPYNENNLGLHVGDDPNHVMKNRQQLRELLKLPEEPVWLEQTHSTTCIIPETDLNRCADAAITRSPLHPLVILTADCLPITLCNIQGDEIAAIHAGWKGLFNGIVENTLAKMNSHTSDVLAWIGPAICQNCYEVGDEVYQSFTEKYPLSHVAFKSTGNKWLANLPKIAKLILNLHGVTAVYQSDLCTFELKNDFYSYRRQSQTGRIGTFIWFNDQPRDE